MKIIKYISYIIVIIILFHCSPDGKKPRVIITTDINNAGDDPDDKQSLVHVLWYADELDIVGIILDYWNGRGRNEVYNDPRFNNLWWLESNWTYNGMFMGEGPRIMFEKLSTYGSMGAFIKTATKGHDWAQYFRVGDTTTVLYLIDPANNLEDPSLGSWAGKFKKPFPEKRPNYWTDDNGDIFWDYSDPCNSWENVEEMYAFNKNTLFQQRQDMYDELIKKLNKLYKK